MSNNQEKEMEEEQVPPNDYSINIDLEGEETGYMGARLKYEDGRCAEVEFSGAVTPGFMRVVSQLTNFAAGVSLTTTLPQGFPAPAPSGLVSAQQATRPGKVAGVRGPQGGW